MEDKIIQISGFGVENNQSTQCSYMIVGLTQSGRVVITNGDRKWADISPDASEPENPADAKNLCGYCEDIGRNGEPSHFCRKCGAPLI